MRVGVITFSNSKDNYGQMLQIYAMQQFIKKQGHECYLIRYQDTLKEGAAFKWCKIFIYLLKFPKYLSWYIGQKKEQKAQSAYVQRSGNELRRFDNFLHDNVEVTEQIFNEKSIVKNPPQADAYICGSDQIWCGDWAYYLNFAPERSIKIAYAPSMGGITTFVPKYEAEMRRLIKRLDFIGMREQSGVDVCHHLGRKDAVKVVDPTLLLNKEDFNHIRIPIKKNKPYIYLYLLGNPIKQETKEFYDYAESKGLDIIYVASQGKNDSYNKFPAQIGEWIDLLADAEIVITNSFHCTVFSLLYQKKFITIPLCNGYERMNTRIFELLKEVKLEDQILYGELKSMPLNIAFDDFCEYQKREVKRSTEYFSNILNPLR